MRPTLLEIDGLLSYRTAQSIDFSNIEFAAIVGENGAGKSSLLSTMLFALFGSVQGNNMDLILSTGVDEGSAALEFDFDGHSWRVTRTRVRGKRTTAQILKWDPEVSDWEIIADGSVRAVDLEIQRLLRVDENAFRATVMLAQNEAGAFSTATPAERKEVLGRIVGLDRYTRLAQAAKERANELKVEAGTKAALVEQLEGRLNGEEGAIEELGRVTTDLATAEGVREDFEKRANDADAERKSREDAIDALSNAIESRRVSLTERARSANGDYERALENRSNAEDAVNGLKEELSGESNKANDLASATQAFDKKAMELKVLGEEMDALIKNGQASADDVATKAATQATLQAQADAGRERINALAAHDQSLHGECWVCGTALDEQKRTDLTEEVAAALKKLDAELESAQEASREASEKVERLRGELRAKRSGKEQLELAVAGLRTNMEEAKAAATNVERIAKGLTIAEQALVGTEQALTEAAAKRIDVEADPQIVKATQKLVESEDKLTAFPGGAALRARAASAASDVRTLSNRKAVLDSKVEQFAQDRKDLEGLTTERDALLAGSRKFDTLRQAFGRDGIPALIYAGVVVELNDHINDVLGHLSDGQFSVELVTTKETKKGTLNETLEVMILAPDGARPYGSFSGGEKFRIDIAIRLGLARLLANRHGAKMGFLAIDEGWGALDPQGIAAMVAELNKLRGEFPLILTVTHIDAIQEGFGTLIRVHKTAGGSMVSVE